MEYKVKESDLKGQIKDFPIEIVQKMVERQYEQTGKCDVKVFQSEKYASSYEDGFRWSQTPEGHDFWRAVISKCLFDVFFIRYPKYYYIKRTSETKINDIISKLVSLGGKSIYKNYGIHYIYYIDPISKDIERCDNGTPIAHLIETFYTETFVDTVYEYTMDEIAEKLGIDVKQLKIKK